MRYFKFLFGKMHQNKSSKKYRFVYESIWLMEKITCCC
jgi:hypothetical protein